MLLNSSMGFLLVIFKAAPSNIQQWQFPWDIHGPNRFVKNYTVDGGLGGGVRFVLCPYSCLSNQSKLGTNFFGLFHTHKIRISKE